jgi:dienelactone hydrolase
VERLVNHGYLIAVPDVYHRCPSAMPMVDRKTQLKDFQIVVDAILE